MLIRFVDATAFLDFITPPPFVSFIVCKIMQTISHPPVRPSRGSPMDTTFSCYHSSIRVASLTVEKCFLRTTTRHLSQLTVWISVAYLRHIPDRVVSLPYGGIYLAVLYCFATPIHSWTRSSSVWISVLTYRRGQMSHYYIRCVIVQLCILRHLSQPDQCFWRVLISPLCSVVLLFHGLFIE